MKAEWKIPIFKADADAVAQELETMDSITPEKVVELARDESTELHKCFEWNDSAAAHKYRCIQAQKVIINLVVTDKRSEEPVPVRIFYNTTAKNEYKPVRFFMQNEDEYMELLKKARAELHSFKQKYSSLNELSEIMALID